MKIEFVLNGTVVAEGKLDDNATSKDFASLLPLNLTFEDYEATEKIAGLPRPLALEGPPAAYLPVTGDICFYAPWGNLAIFYRDGEPSSGLVRLGRLQAEGEQAWLMSNPSVRLVFAAI